MRFELSPTTVIAGAALFFALGGSALAVSDAVRPQARCANGAVRGFALVTGDPTKGIANIGDQFTASRVVFGGSFNCTGKGTQVRRLGLGVYEVRFVGNPTAVATVGGANAESTIQPLGSGTFRIGLHVPGRQDSVDAPFTVIAA